MTWKALLNTLRWTLFSLQLLFPSQALQNESQMTTVFTAATRSVSSTAEWIWSEGFSREEARTVSGPRSRDSGPVPDSTHCVISVSASVPGATALLMPRTIASQRCPASGARDRWEGESKYAPNVLRVDWILPSTVESCSGAAARADHVQPGGTTGWRDHGMNTKINDTVAAICMASRRSGL